MSGRTFTIGQRTAAAIGTVVVTLAAVVFAALGPLRPGWSHGSGTSSALLAQIAARYASPSVPASPNQTGAQPPPTPSHRERRPTHAVHGGPRRHRQKAGPHSQGNVQVTLSMRLHDVASTPLAVTLNGTAANGGGVVMSSGTVTFGSDPGVVIALNGGTVTAMVQATSTIQLGVPPLDRQSEPLPGRSPARLTRGAIGEPRHGSVSGSGGCRSVQPFPSGPAGLPRLLAGLDSAGLPVPLDQHLARWGRLPALNGVSIPTNWSGRAPGPRRGVVPGRHQMAIRQELIPETPGRCGKRGGG